MKLKGYILFDPSNITKKHLNQSSWKRMAFLMFPSDICEYYSWFLHKRYNLELNLPIRRAHISFINDSIDDIMKGKAISEAKANVLWADVRKKYNRTEIEIGINTDLKSDGKHWWLQVPFEERYVLQNIRNELGLGIPFFGMHCSIGYANEKSIHHSRYIYNLITKFENSYN